MKVRKHSSSCRPRLHCVRFTEYDRLYPVSADSQGPNMPLEDLDSFDEPTVLHLTRPCRLHPNACNPQMDLVALLYLPSAEEIEEGDDGSSVELWRTSGEECVKVWEREVKGYVVGMDWSLDGLQLSLLSYPGFGASTSAQAYSLVHLSVHDGLSLATISIGSSHVPDKQTWLSMRWIKSDDPWPAVEKGSAGNILDSLPGIEKVEPVLPPHAMYQFQPALALKAKKALDVPDSTLINFPTVPPTNPAVHPGILLIPPLGQQLLSGTFPGSGELIMRLAQTSQRMKGILDNVIKGIASAQAAWKEALKQGQLWQEELEECETAAGEPKGSAKAGLSLLLMNGQCLQSVTDFLSHRVTGRSLTKWKGTVTSSLQKIHRLMINSVIPGLERVMVLLEEMSGWAIDIKFHSLGIDASAIEQCQIVARRLARMATLLNRDAEYKAKISHDFFDWLAYQVELINTSDYADMEIRPTFNILDVWEYLEHGLVLETTFKTKRSVHYFPSFDVDPFRGPVNLSKLCPEDQRSQSVDKSLGETMDSTLELLQGQVPDRELLSDISFERSEVVSAPEQGYPCLTDLVPELVRRCQQVIQSAKPPHAAVGTLPHPLVGPYEVETSSWYAGVLDRKAAPSLEKLTGVLFCESPGNQLKAACLDLSADNQITTVPCMGFFDASEIAFVVNCPSATDEQCTMLATTQYQDLDFQDVSRYGSLQQAWQEVPALLSKSQFRTQPLTVARSQVLNFTSAADGQPSIALNGRKKRRTACVLSPSGQELQVFSLWISGVDDDGDDEEEEEETEAVEGNDAMEQ